MLFYESVVKDPYYNLALEEFFFEHMDRGESYFILWQNENTIVVGKYQNTAQEINREFVDSHGIRVARRLSGGGAVYHDGGNLNYTFIADKSDNEDFDFKPFALPVIKTLDEFGVKAVFSGRNDLTIDGRKFSGNAQYMKNNRILHHGCIMLDTNLTNVADALMPKTGKYISKGIKSVKSPVTTINAHTKVPVSMEQFKSRFIRNVLSMEQMDVVELSHEQEEKIEGIRSQKYATWDWNYGLSPDYDVSRTVRFDGGTVSAYYDVESGKLKSVKFYGDFFGNGDIAELENRLISVPLDESLIERLTELNIGGYMAGITPEELYSLLT